MSKKAYEVIDGNYTYKFTIIDKTKAEYVSNHGSAGEVTPTIGSLGSHIFDSLVQQGAIVNDEFVVGEPAEKQLIYEVKNYSGSIFEIAPVSENTYDARPKGAINWNEKGMGIGSMDSVIYKDLESQGAIRDGEFVLRHCGIVDRYADGEDAVDEPEFVVNLKFFYTCSPHSPHTKTEKINACNLETAITKALAKYPNSELIEG